MRKILMVLILLFVSVPVFAEESDNISLTDGWNVVYKRGWSDEPVFFKFENISGQPAFKITAMVYCYGDSDEIIKVFKFEEQGPILKRFYAQSYIPSSTKTITAEVYNIWEYNP